MLTGLAKDLPQGAATLSGPGGIAMDATAEEFVQTLRLTNGPVLRTSGYIVRAAPSLSEPNASFHRVEASAVMTGSMNAPEPGTYPFMEDPPRPNFIDAVLIAGGSLVETNDPASRVRATSGSIRIESVSYFPDIHECTFESANLVIEQCQFQLGVISGSFDMRVSLASGEVVFQPTAFTLPIRRRAITARQP